MLKFIRKFQLVILAIGGSLLMVVFLLEPVLTSFQRSQMNRTVARLADGEKITMLDIERGRMEIELARRVAGIVFLPKEANGLGLEFDSADGSDTYLYHWILLSRMAEEAGLVGGAEDGRQLIEIQMAAESRELVQRLQFAVMQGAVDQEQAIQQLGEYQNLRRQQLDREIQQATGYIRNSTEDDMWRALAKFTGVYRMIRMYQNAPAFSPAGAIVGLQELGDAVAVDAALIPGDLLAGEIPDPSEEELEAFFAPRAALTPEEDPYGIGYAQPARLRLGWLVLSRADMGEAVVLDRVELRKLWELDSRKPEDQRTYPGDFASERPRVEVDYRRDRVDQLMVEADRVIRAEVLRATRTLDRDGARMILPQDWASTRPHLDNVAEAVVTRLGEQGVNLRTPTVQLMENTWLTGEQIAAQPGIGRAFFRIGSRTVLSQELPDLLGANGMIEDLNMQVGVPQSDPAAQDSQGNRYYPIVFEHRPAGPARSIDDAGRERVLADYKSLEGYNRLTAMLDELRAAVEDDNGVRAAIDLAMANADDSRVVRPSVLRNILVSRLQVSPSQQSRTVDPRLNDPIFRDRVVETVQGIDPLATPESVASDPRGVGVALPQARAVALARVVAPRPFTADDLQASVRGAVSFLAQRTMEDAILESEAQDPFGYEAVRERFGLETVETPGEG